MLWSMGSQRVRHDSATELKLSENYTKLKTNENLAKKESLQCVGWKHSWKLIENIKEYLRMMNTVCIIFLEEFHLHFLLNTYTLLFRIPYSGWLQNMHYPKHLPYIVDYVLTAANSYLLISSISKSMSLFLF